MAELSGMSLDELIRLREQMGGGQQPAPVAPAPAPAAAPDLSAMSLEDLMALRNKVSQQPAAGPDIAKATGSGLARGVTSLIGLPGDVAKMLGSGADAAAEWLTGQKIPDAVKRNSVATAMGSENINRKIDAATGLPITSYKPQTTAGKYAQTVGEFVPGALAGPGGVARNLVGGVAGGLASEAAGQATAGTKYEPYARVAAGIAAPVATSYGLTRAAQPSVPGASRGAARMLADDLDNSGGAAAVRQRLDELGPDAMFLDASPSLQGRAQGLAIQPDTREMINAPLIARNQQRNQRLAADVDGALGPAPVPSQIEAGLEASRGVVGAQYPQVFQGARAVDTAPLANALDTMAVDTRGPARDAVVRARGYLNIPGTQTLDPNPQALHATRKALDGIIQGGETNTDVLRNLGFARQAVDDELRAAVPGIKDVDARIQELSRQSEGLTRGSQVLDGGKTAVRPVELADEITQAVTPAGQMVGPSGSAFRMRQGARAELDRLVGTRANDLEALKQAVKGDGDWNRAKLAQLFGEAEAGRVFNAVDREAAFADAYKKIVENSQTAQRTAAAEATTPRGGGGGGGMTRTMLASLLGGPVGAAAAIGGEGAKAVGNAAVKASDIGRNKELARILTQPVSDPSAANVLDALERLRLAPKTPSVSAQLARAVMSAQSALR